MCGIAGYYSDRLNRDDLALMTNVLNKRGPDANGFFLKDSIGLGHRRLSIVELSELGAQPYYYEQLVLIFNGEIYNYQEIREKLKAAGYTFLSNSDTEVLIKAFHYWREKAVDQMIGMFAFAVYDQTTRELFLFRDRVGVKPLYFSYNENGLVFGSELKVFSKLKISQSISPEASYQYFKFGYTTNDNSIFKEIKKVLPGHYLRFDGKKIELNRYWYPNKYSFDGKSEQQISEELLDLLISSFRYRMVSDVPVGVFLSGGIDSSLVTSILQRHHGNINTLTIGFDHDVFNEAPFARQVATHLKTNHIEDVMNAKKARDLLDNFYDIYDEPFSDSSGIPTAYVSALARKNNIRVVLSADGGDELFCGYSHYKKISQHLSRFYYAGSFKKNSINAAAKLLKYSGVLRAFPHKNIEHKVLHMADLVMSKDVIEFYENSISNQAQQELDYFLTNPVKFKSLRYGNMNFPSVQGHEQDEEKMMQWDFLHYLPDDLLVKVDRATMYHSIEGREPFLDHRLIEYAFSLPMQYKIRNGKNKYILKELLGRYVPEEYFERPKKGFSIPIFQWFNEDLNGMFDKYFQKSIIERTGILVEKEVTKEFEKYKYYQKRGQSYNIEKMWRILSFLMWQEKWYRG